ncbi:MAG: aryl-sulfate sulfotransferase [Bacteroidetes bacterium]|nr:aryl-sulfate sulfotransferase [Bacteroidota bacterium]
MIPRIRSFIVLFLCFAVLQSQTITVSPSLTSTIFPNGVSVPSDYPHVKFLVKGNASPGHIFINNWGGTPYIAILDSNGAPVFYRRMPGNARDFKVQKNGNLSYRIAEPYYRQYEMDSSYTVLREITAKNGQGTDEHELQILPNGNVLLISLDYRTIDMSAIVPGGKTNVTVVGNNVQEIDPAGNVVFEWKCWDHMKISDAVRENLTAQTIDFVHMNAIELDLDGNILISSRHQSEITKIDRKTGRVMWRFGGKNNQFTYLNDPLGGPSYQHDIRVLPNGNYTMLDNGNFHSPSLTRAVEYSLDTAARTAQLVWQYRHVPDRYTWWMGNAQRLANGNTLINWADQSLPKVTEVTPAGVKVLEMDFVKAAHSYRVFKFPWKGKGKQPELYLEAGSNKITLLFNTFDQRPSHWYRIYADTVASPVRCIDSTQLSAVDLKGFKNGKRYYFRVTSRNADGSESPMSNEVTAVARFYQPGDNLITNGDFSDGLNDWKFNLTSPGAAVPYVTEAGALFMQIGAGGTQAWHIQPSQEGIPVTNGLPYRFEFDAWATAPRTIDPKIVMIAAPNTNYSRTGSIFLTTEPQHFRFDFTMTDATDNNARVVFNCGLSDADVFVDNVSFRQRVPVAVQDEHATVPRSYDLLQNFPNPFNPSTTIRFALPHRSFVRLSVLDPLGREIALLLQGERNAGMHDVVWNADRFASGMYLCRLTTAAGVTVRRMQLLR